MQNSRQAFVLWNTRLPHSARSFSRGKEDITHMCKRDTYVNKRTLFLWRRGFVACCKQGAMYGCSTVNNLHPQPHGLNGGAFWRATRRQSTGMLVSDGYSSLMMIGKSEQHLAGYGATLAVLLRVHRVSRPERHRHRQGSPGTFATSRCRCDPAGRPGCLAFPW